MKKVSSFGLGTVIDHPVEKILYGQKKEAKEEFTASSNVQRKHVRRQYCQRAHCFCARFYDRQITRTERQRLKHA
jgi:hypothetical protein